MPGCTGGHPLSETRCFVLGPFSPVPLSATPWTVACQAPRSMGFPRQEYWSGWTFPSPGDLPHAEVEYASPALQVYSLPVEPPGKPTLSKILEKKKYICIYPSLLDFLGIPFKELKKKKTGGAWIQVRKDSF